VEKPALRDNPELACQLVNSRIALALAKADDNPSSLLPLPQKIRDLRSSEATWASLHPKFITSLPVTLHTSSIYDLSRGTYLLGDLDRKALQYLQLPTTVDDPLDWQRITVDNTFIDMGFCVFEHDLIAIVTRLVFSAFFTSCNQLITHPKQYSK
jgi:hypothetical protein